MSDDALARKERPHTIGIHADGEHWEWNPVSVVAGMTLWGATSHHAANRLPEAALWLSPVCRECCPEDGPGDWTEVTWCEGHNPHDPCDWCGRMAQPFRRLRTAPEIAA